MQEEKAKAAANGCLTILILLFIGGVVLAYISRKLHFIGFYQKYAPQKEYQEYRR